VPATALPLLLTLPENPGPKYVPFRFARSLRASSVVFLNRKPLNGL